MKWNSYVKTGPSFHTHAVNSTRQVEKFLWWPKLIDGQWRCLTKGQWTEQCFTINGNFLESKRLPDYMVVWVPQYWNDRRCKPYRPTGITTSKEHLDSLK